jgi:hypothetical protein
LCLLYTADLPTSPKSTTATFADDTEVVTMDSDPAIGSQKLQTNLLTIQNWFKKWRMKANESKLIHITFAIQREMCPPVHINSVQLPQEDIKYLGLHLDRRLTWHKHIFAKRKQLGMTPHKNVLVSWMQVKTLQATNFLYIKLKPIKTYAPCGSGLE